MEREALKEIVELVVLPLALVIGTAIGLRRQRDRLRPWHLVLALVGAVGSVATLVLSRAHLEANRGSWGALVDLFVFVGAIPIALVSVTATITILLLSAGNGFADPDETARRDALAGGPPHPWWKRRIRTPEENARLMKLNVILALAALLVLGVLRLAL